MIDVVIIGAGGAGIAAARRLLAAGLNIQILEARARVGGRAATDTATLGVPADLGAAWLHFADENPWTPLAREQGLTVIEREPDWRADHQSEFERNWGLIEAAAAAGLDVPVSSLLPDDAYRPRFDGILTWFAGVESHQASCLDIARYAESRHDWAVAEGLGSVLAGAAAGLPVQLGTPVTAIDWRGPGVRVTTAAGTLRARAALVTLPTSVLAAGGLRFTHALPTPLQQAFADLPLGSCNKVFFRVDPALLPPETHHAVGNPHSARTTSLALRPAGQPLVMAYFGGELSLELEASGQLEAFAREEVALAFGHDLVAGLQGSLVTGWNQDPWALGSYSAARPGAANARLQLAEPPAPWLHFAGEASSVTHYSTLVGAWRSGISAATQLIETLRTSP